MTTKIITQKEESCPAEGLLKLLAGKWKPQIFRLASEGNPLRFNRLVRQLEGATKQSIAVVLKELEQTELLQKKVIKLKPLHIEYTLTEKGIAMLPIFKQLENML